MAEVELGAEEGGDREAEVAQRLRAFRGDDRQEGAERSGSEVAGKGIGVRSCWFVSRVVAVVACGGCQNDHGACFLATQPYSSMSILFCYVFSTCILCLTTRSNVDHEQSGLPTVARQLRCGRTAICVLMLEMHFA